MQQLNRSFLPTPTPRRHTLILALCALLFASCAAPVHREAEIATVEGVVSVRGHVPFEAVVLQTDARNYYVLKLGQAQRDGLLTPGRYRVRGRIYLDDWDGRPFAHLEVVDIEATGS